MRPLGLCVREHDRDQHRADAQGQDTDLTGGRGAQRQEHRERGLGAVRGRGERIEPQHGQGGDGADPFGFLFGRAQRLAEEQLVQLHKRGCSAREMPAAGMLGRCSEVATFPSDFGTVGV